MKATFGTLIALVLFASCSSVKKATWSMSQNVKTPESVYQDPVSKLVFVSNMDGGPTDKNKSGYISLLDPNLRIKKTKWITGLNAPKGMRSHKGVLWVTDIDRVHAINIKQAQRIGTIKIASAKFLNDIAIGPHGEVYISDMLTDKIHKIKSGIVSTFVEGASLAHPNGLQVKNGKLYVAAWGMNMSDDWTTKTLGTIYSVDLKSKKIIQITSPLGNLDGLEFDNKGNFLVSDWMAGKVFTVKPTGESELIYQGPQGTADIGYLSSQNKVVVPLMKTDKIIGFKL